MKPSLSLASLLCCLLLLAACNNEHPNPGMYNKAIVITQRLDSNALQPFRNWSTIRQGHTTILRRNNTVDSEGYTLVYRKTNDTAVIAVTDLARFQKDFLVNGLSDITSYTSLQCTSVHNDIINICTTGQNTKEYTMDTTMAVSRLFPALNPFLVADSLTRLMDSLQIISTSYKPSNANGMVFWLTWNRPLVYLPGDGKITLLGKDSSFWKKILPTGKRISKNWLLCDYERH